MRSRIIVFLLSAVCATATFAQSQPPGNSKLPQRKAGLRVPEGVKVLRDLEYVTNGHERNRLDLYLPKEGKGVPLVVWVHGGGWQAGSKENCPAIPLTEKGYAVASINYRLSSHAIFPAQIIDCKAALRWLRARAAEYGYNADRIAVWGSSAGGHLVALLGTSGDVKEFDQGENLKFSSRVQAVVDWFGPTDFTQMSKFSSSLKHDAADSPESKLIGGAIQENKDKVARANPITYVTSDDAAFLIMHGDKDPLVPLNQSELLVTALKKVGVPVTLKVIEGAGHGGAGFNSLESNQMIQKFLDTQIKSAAK